MNIDQWKAAINREPVFDDLSREQVLAIYRAAGDAELRRHVPELQTDGCGNIGFLCCGQTMTRDAWWIHTNNWLKHATSVKPQKKR